MQVVTENGWEHFPHEADVGIRGFGRTRAAAFEQAALAMTAAVTDPGDVEQVDEIELTCAAPDDELLLVDWLNALVYEMATRSMLFSRFEIEIDAGRLRGRAWGEGVDVERHKPAVEVKGATYTSLRVGQDPDGTWVAQCVIDV
jgi:tRNA nucleotidyltransferase (CCA-adding enzyme)